MKEAAGPSSKTHQRTSRFVFLYIRGMPCIGLRISLHRSINCLIIKFFKFVRHLSVKPKSVSSKTKTKELIH